MCLKESERLLNLVKKLLAMNPGMLVKQLRETSQVVSEQVIQVLEIMLETKILNGTGGAGRITPKGDTSSITPPTQSLPKKNRLDSDSRFHKFDAEKMENCDN